MKRPLAGPVGFFIVGILVAGIIFKAAGREFITTIGILLFIAILFSAVFVKSNKVFYVSVYVFFFLLGIFSALRIFPARFDIGEFVSAGERKAVIFGTVSGMSEDINGVYGRYSVFPLKIKKLSIGGEELLARGFVRVKIFDSARKVYFGEDIVIGGRISEGREAKNYGTFDYKKYLRARRIQAVMSSLPSDVFLKTKGKKSPMFLFRKWLSDKRTSAKKNFEKHLLKPASAILKSVILGARGDLTEEIRDVFIKTGTMHILAVSGLHVGIVAVILTGILRLARCPKKLTFLLTIFALCVFTVFTGARPSTLRAAIMASFILINLAIGKNSDIVNSLIISAFVITFFQPEQIYNLGFILSYLSIVSIVYLMPFVKAFFDEAPRTFSENKIDSVKRYFFTSLATSFSVWIGLMPIIALNFGIITPSVVISNLFAVPVLFAVIMLGAGLMLTEVSVIFVPAGVLIARIINGIIHVFVKSMQIISEMPLAFVKVGGTRMVLMGMFYAGLVFTIIVFSRKKRKILFVIFLLFMVNLFVWQEILNASPDGFKCTFFSVGKADAALLEFPDGSSMMIDGGSGGSRTGRNSGRDVVEPYLRRKGKRKIDCILVSHAHEDHVGGFPYIMENFEMGQVILSEHLLNDAPQYGFYRDFLRIIKKNNTKLLTATGGDRIKGFPGTEIEVLNPTGGRKYSDINDRSLVVNLKTERGTKILFCADISSNVTNEILSNYPELKIDIIKFPHHGGGFGSIPDIKRFLDAVNPKAVIITNKTRAVNKELIEILKEKQIELYITGTAGAVTIKENTAGFKISTFCDSRR